MAALFAIVGIIVAISFHEFAHALAADLLGDPNPRNKGRVSLNPLAHLDPIGFGLIFFTGFGWGKPVAFDPYNLKSPKRDSAIIAFAGPLANLILAFLCMLLLKFPFSASIFYSTLKNALYPLIIINLSLAIFNLIPVYPLDGSHILSAILPKNLSYQYEVIMEKFGIFILFFLIAPLYGNSAISAILTPLLTFFYNTFENVSMGLISLIT
jgi:Zn-dependent protease